VRVLPGLLFCVLLAAAWQFMAVRWNSPLIPGLRDIAEQPVTILRSGDAVLQIGTTLARIAGGVAFAFVIALGVGLASARNRFARAFFEPAQRRMSTGSMPGRGCAICGCRRSCGFS
jgi:NitT/TauT family transport system permease protein